LYFTVIGTGAEGQGAIAPPQDGLGAKYTSALSFWCMILMLGVFTVWIVDWRSAVTLGQCFI